MAYAYDSRGNLTAEIIDPGDENSVRTEYRNIDKLGHADTVAVIANGITRKSAVIYTPSGRFVQRKTDPLNVSATYDWDEATGLLNSETGVFGTTIYRYNDLKQLIEKQTPDGIRSTSVLQWETPGNAFGAKYYKYSETSGKAPECVWYDAYGREVRKETFGLENKAIAVSTLYNEKGLVDKVSDPYFAKDESSKKWATIYSYDDYNRVDTLTTLAGQTTYTYGPYLTTTVKSPNGTITKEVNTIGQTILSRVNDRTVEYEYYSSGLIGATYPEEGESIRMEYDQQGHRTKLIDPDAGTVTSKYNGFGELQWERQKVHTAQDSTTTIHNYHANGLLRSVVRKTEAATGVKMDSIVYTYDAANHYRLDNIELAGKNKQKFTYGSFDRIMQVDETVGTKTFTSRTEYDALGREKKHYYPTGYYPTSHYETNGNLSEVTDKNNKSIWKAIEENALGQLMQIGKGGKVTTFGYQANHMPQSIYADGVTDQCYSFNAKGNLEYRQVKINSTTQREDFDYDNQNRLHVWEITRGGFSKIDSLSYDANGNISAINALGNLTMKYGEGNGKPHALTSILGKPDAIPSIQLNATYTDFRKMATLKEGNRSYALTYGVDDQRRISLDSVGGVLKLTRYYLGDYEEEVDASGNIRKIHYISGGNGLAAIFLENNGVDSLLYAYTDYQGSLIALADVNGDVVERYAYDPWGQRRDPDQWELKDSRSHWLVNRGYTGHEHLDAFGLINMNGRVYDPITAMFLSPDPDITFEDDWLNYNRYAYGLNNPFMYIDPDGENSVIIIFLIVNGGIKVIENWDAIEAAWGKDKLTGILKAGGFFAIGAGQAAATYFGGAAGMTLGSYSGDYLTALLRGDKYSPAITTASIGVSLLFQGIPIGDKLGSGAAKSLGGNKLIQDLTKNIVSSHVNNFLGDVALRTWENGGDLGSGIRDSWKDYKNYKWATSTLSGAGKWTLDNFDARTMIRNKNEEAMKEHLKKNNDLSYFKNPYPVNGFMENFYNQQMKLIINNTTINTRRIKTSRPVFTPSWNYKPTINRRFK